MSPVLIIILVVALAGVIYATAKAPRLTSVLLWSLVATTFSSAAILLTLPGPFSEKALIMTVAVPLIWAGYQFWCYWDASKWRVVSGLIAISVIGGIVVYLTEPLV